MGGPIVDSGGETEIGMGGGPDMGVDTKDGGGADMVPEGHRGSKSLPLRGPGCPIRISPTLKKKKFHYDTKIFFITILHSQCSHLLRKNKRILFFN